MLLSLLLLLLVLLLLSLLLLFSFTGFSATVSYDMTFETQDNVTLVFTVDLNDPNSTRFLELQTYFCTAVSVPQKSAPFIYLSIYLFVFIPTG